MWVAGAHPASVAVMEVSVKVMGIEPGDDRTTVAPSRMKRSVSMGMPGSVGGTVIRLAWVRGEMITVSPGLVEPLNTSRPRALRVFAAPGPTSEKGSVAVTKLGPARLPQ